MIIRKTSRAAPGCRFFTSARGAIAARTGKQAISSGGFNLSPKHETL